MKKHSPKVPERPHFIIMISIIFRVDDIRMTFSSLFLPLLRYGSTILRFRSRRRGDFSLSAGVDLVFVLFGTRGASPSVAS